MSSREDHALIQKIELAVEWLRTRVPPKDTSAFDITQLINKSINTGDDVARSSVICALYHNPDKFNHFIEETPKKPHWTLNTSDPIVERSIVSKKYTHATEYYVAL